MSDLDAARIADLLETRCFGRSLDVRQSTSSTNDDAREASGVPNGHVVLADHQLAGRGSRGRRWSSPAGTDLYFSILLRDFPRTNPSHRGRLCAALARRQVPGIAELYRGSGNAARVVHRRPNAGFVFGKALTSTGLELSLLPPLTLAVGLGVALACEQITEHPFELKWPNDVRHGSRKCAGILVESVSIGARLERVVIGVGLDVNRESFGELDGIATSLRQATGRELDREAVFARVLESIETEVERFIERGPAAIVPRVAARLAWLGQEVTCDGAKGTLRGLREDGALLVGDQIVLSGTLQLA